MGNRKLNILYLCADRGISIYGTKGASAHIREFGSAIIQSGNKITLAVREVKGERRGNLPFRAVALPQFSASDSLDSGPAGSAERYAASEMKEFQLNKTIEKALAGLGTENEFDIVYERYSLFSEAGINFARAAGLPFILEVNAPLVLEASRYRKLTMAEVAGEIEQSLFSSADHVIAVSEKLREYILRISPGARVTVVPNGVDPARFEGSYDNARSSSREFTVGFVGNIRPWHGIDKLIEAFAKFVSRAGNGRLLLVGDAGKMQSQLEEQCNAHGLNGRVEFVGAVASEKIPGIMDEIDVAVAPYPPMADFYFSALKIFEYMAAGKPIVASRIGQINDILEDGKTGILVPPGDIAALVDAFLILSLDKELRSTLGRNARIEAELKHTWEKRIDVITGIAERLCANQGN
jgi:glycosyltransferase involved in cell wall biosynthesis